MNVLRPIQREFYGDDYRWFFGTVVNAQPPEGLEGRVKVRIRGVHSPKTEDIPEKDLPWAQVLVPTTEGGVSGYGRIPQILAGSFVFGIFLDGISSQIPLILGSLPRVEFPSSVQTARVGISETDVRLQNSVTERLLNDEEPSTSTQLRRQQSMKFFIDNGYEPIHAAAITGALQGVSKFVTYEENNPNALRTGIVSWSRSVEAGSRWNGLLEFSLNFQPQSDWRLFSIQLQYVLFELRNRFGSANRRLVNTTDIEAASSVVNQYYVFSSNDTTNLAQLAYDEVFV